MKRFVSAIVFLSFLVLMVTPARADDVVKLGINEIRSGAFKTNGDRIIWGVETAAKEVNQAGGLLGKKIEIVVEDNQMKGEIAVQKVKKMVLKDGCQIIIQGSSSGVGGAIAQTMPRYKEIYLDTCAEAVAITGEHFTPYTFRTCLNAAMHVKGLAQYFSKKGFKKVFLINQDYSWGHDVAKYYEKFIKEIAPDSRIVGNGFHKVFNKDFAPYISKIQASGADYVITGNWGTDLTQLIIQSRSLGMKIPIGCAFMDDDVVMSVARESAKGCVTANMYLLGVDTPKAKAFEDSFHKIAGDKWPGFVIMEAYIGIKMYFEAVKKAGTFETHAVIKAFEGLQWEGPVGTLTMRKEDHQNQTPVVIGEYAEKTKYYDFPYIKPVTIIPAEQASLSPEESGWKPWKR